MKTIKRLGMNKRVTCVLAVLAMLAGRVEAATTLDPTNPANFQREGTQGFTPGSLLTLADQSIGDVIVFIAPDADAVAGVELDVVATFQVRFTIPNNADVGNRIAINDGQ
jgi:hypothetical protein